MVRREWPGDDRDDPPVVVEFREPADPPLERITLYFHPQVPEATLVVLRPWIPL